jgi:hypothetical protein
MPLLLYFSQKVLIYATKVLKITNYYKLLHNGGFVIKAIAIIIFTYA